MCATARENQSVNHWRPSELSLSLRRVYSVLLYVSPRGLAMSCGPCVDMRLLN